MVGARDKVTHEYFGIDLEVIWTTIQDDLPILKREINQMINAQSAEGLKN